ncbi:hypothetical protein MLD38_007033 [Melastoma candidum]|uniref:Uncharacterized protein n=1 Tax=Melastoma candidum TaxID=119954 RepID=A0ACB9RPB9_9MYRT|nr:hypothetical protein MLD38_007033 [Melastoma candidum]
MDRKPMSPKMKPSSQDGPMKPKAESFSSGKKIEVKSNPSPSKTTAKRVTTTTTTTTTTTKAREKKVYSLPGQKHDPPEEREPLRIFYESLFTQVPTSEMAEFWMMEHGLLSPERAKRAFEKKQRKQKQIRMGTPIKSPNTPSKPESSQRPPASRNSGTIKANKRTIQESYDEDDDFVPISKRRNG